VQVCAVYSCRSCFRSSSFFSSFHGLVQSTTLFLVLLCSSLPAVCNGVFKFINMLLRYFYTLYMKQCSIIFVVMIFWQNRLEGAFVVVVFCRSGVRRRGVEGCREGGVVWIPEELHRVLLGRCQTPPAQLYRATNLPRQLSVFHWQTTP